MEYRISGGILTIEPGVELDHHQTEEIIRYAQGIIRQRQPRMVLFDLADTVFMDSAGVGMMIGLYKEMKARNGTVGVIHMQAGIRRIYRLAGLSKIIRCYGDEAELTEAMKGGGGAHEG